MLTTPPDSPLSLTSPEEETLPVEEDEYDEEPMQGRTLGWYLEARAKQDRKPFEPFDIAVEYVKAKRFSRMSDFAAFFGHSPCWATDFKALAIRQGVFTIEEWRACFQRGHSLGRPIEDCRTWAEQQAKEQASQPTVIQEEEKDEPCLSTHDGYLESYSVVMERIRQGELTSERAIGRFYRMGQQKVKSFLADIIESGLVTEDEWSEYMRRRTRRRHVVSQQQQTEKGELNDDETSTRITIE